MEDHLFSGAVAEEGPQHGEQHVENSIKNKNTKLLEDSSYFRRHYICKCRLLFMIYQILIYVFANSCFEYKFENAVYNTFYTEAIFTNSSRRKFAKCSLLYSTM